MVDFEHQHVADIVVMWMVVAMTCSGVALAAFQIFHAARISPVDGGAAVDSSELAIERDRIYLRSSVTGLFILIVSFAFFYVYIVHVYTIVQDDRHLDGTPVQPVGPGVPVVVPDPAG